MARKEFPSHFYPDFFKMDLGVGGENENPLSRALDAWVRNLDFEAQKKIFAIHPDNVDEAGQRRMLERLGFRCENLNSDQVFQFLTAVHEILAGGGTLGAIERMAQIYFGDVEVSRGRQFEKIRLADRQEANSLVFIRLKQVESDEKMAEFTKNAQSLVPFGFSVKVGLPLLDYQAPDHRISLGAPVRVQERKL